MRDDPVAPVIEFQENLGRIRADGGKIYEALWSRCWLETGVVGEVAVAVVIQRQQTRMNAANLKRHYPNRKRGDWGSVALSRSEPETEFAKH